VLGLGAYPFLMQPRVALVLLFALAAPSTADARADDRIFDPHYWSHPHFIDPTYDFEPPPKAELERRASRAERGRSKSATRERDERPRESGRRRR
jgi:hypothetical protein